MSERSDDLVVSAAKACTARPGDFYIDPWRPVERAVITHAHADHSRRGHAHYLAAAPAEGVLRTRLGDDRRCRRSAYGEIDRPLRRAPEPASAGHVLGSAQVRLEHGGRVWVASGDYYVAGASADARETTSPARRSSRCAATASSPSRPSACRSTAGSRRRELFADDRRLVARATPTPAAPAC